MTFPYPHFMPSKLLATVTKVLEATSTSDTITYPGGIQAGDLILLFDWARSGATPSTVVPSGYTQLINVGGSGFRGILSAKLATGSESGSITGMNGTTFDHKRMVVFRRDPVGTGFSEEGDNFNFDAVVGNPAAVAVNSDSAGSKPVLVIGTYGSDGTVDPRTFSPAKDAEYGGTTAWLAWKIYNEIDTPADHSIDMDDEGAGNFVFGGYLLYT